MSMPIDDCRDGFLGDDGTLAFDDTHTGLFSGRTEPDCYVWVNNNGNWEPHVGAIRAIREKKFRALRKSAAVKICLYESDRIRLKIAGKPNDVDYVIGGHCSAELRVLDHEIQIPDTPADFRTRARNTIITAISNVIGGTTAVDWSEPDTKLRIIERINDQLGSRPASARYLDLLVTAVEPISPWIRAHGETGRIKADGGIVSVQTEVDAGIKLLGTKLEGEVMAQAAKNEQEVFQISWPETITRNDQQLFIARAQQEIANASSGQQLDGVLTAILNKLPGVANNTEQLAILLAGNYEGIGRVLSEKYRQLGESERHRFEWIAQLKIAKEKTRVVGDALNGTTASSPRLSSVMPPRGLLPRSGPEFPGIVAADSTQSGDPTVGNIGSDPLTDRLKDRFPGRLSSVKVVTNANRRTIELLVQGKSRTHLVGIVMEGPIVKDIRTNNTPFSGRITKGKSSWEEALEDQISETLKYLK